MRTGVILAIITIVIGFLFISYTFLVIPFQEQEQMKSYGGTEIHPKLVTWYKQLPFPECDSYDNLTHIWTIENIIIDEVVDGKRKDITNEWQCKRCNVIFYVR